jgi:hypothetical protein
MKITTANNKVYNFRCDPVPGISHKTYKFCNWYRLPKLGRIRRLNASVEEKDLAVAKYKYKNLPEWDDRPRHVDKSWKTSCKIRKQWMKHYDRHIDTIKC